MKKKSLFCFLIFILVCGIFYPVFAEDYDISGYWDISGNGYVDKSFVRVSLELTGDLNIITKMGNRLAEDYKDEIIEKVSADLYKESKRRLKDVRFITGHIVDLKITATNLDIKAWSGTIDNSYLTIPVPLPEIRPSNNEPFVLPDISYGEDDYNLTFTVTLNSIYSGTVRINGWVKLDYVGKIELDSLCKLWKAGTDEPEPVDGENKKSGCNSGISSLMLISISAFIFLKIVGGYLTVKKKL